MYLSTEFALLKYVSLKESINSFYARMTILTLHFLVVLCGACFLLLSPINICHHSSNQNGW